MNKIAGILMLLIYVCVATTLLSEAFVSPYNMQNIVRWSALFGIIGIGVAFVIITGGIDLSIGSLIGLVGCLLPMFLIEFRLGIFWSLVLVLLISMAIGLIHGLLITKVGLQPFVVTLCGLLFYRGFARWITGDQTQGFGTDYDQTLRLLATGKPCSVALIMLLAGLAAAGWCAIQLTTAGHDDRRRQVRWFGLVFGLILALIGSSRYWQGAQFVTGSPLLELGGWELKSWSVVVPREAAEMPERLMYGIGWLFAPALVSFVALCLFRDFRRMWFPVAMLLGTALLVAAAMWLVDEPDSSFWPSAAWARTWKILAVFGTLALFLATLAQVGRQGRSLGGPGGGLLLRVGGALGVLWLLGHTPLGETLVPAPVFVMLAIAALAGVFLNQTIYGRYLFALGRNEEAARYSGINTDAMVLLAYVICSTTAGVGGILFALDGNSVQPSGHGNFYELYAIAAAVLGGCSLRGGEGSVLGVMIGAAVMRVLYNSINLLRIPSQLEFAIIGMVILLGVVADEMVKRFAARRRAVEQALPEHALPEHAAPPLARRS